MIKPIPTVIFSLSLVVTISGFSASPSLFQAHKTLGTSTRSAWLSGRRQSSISSADISFRHRGTNCSRRSVVCVLSATNSHVRQPARKPASGPLKLSSREMDDLQPDEAMVEKLVERLESSLDAAIQEERYAEASSIRDELSRMHMDDTSAVLRTNSEFYKAFSSKNIELMGRVWHKSPHVQCIHPGAKPLLGYEHVVGMWREMFQAKDKVFKTTGIVPANVRVQVRGTSAFVTCTEEVRAPGVERRMLATNVFRKYGEEWLLVHHHASQATARPASIEDLLQGASSNARVIRIDGTALSQGQGQTEDIVDEIVRALQGALDDDKDERGKAAFDLGDGDVMHEMLYLEEEEPSEELGMGSGRQDGRRGEEAEEAGVLHERELMEGVTERTVEALRRLAREGKISREVKRGLLTDVIEHHQEGAAASEVEIAYELLVMRFMRPDGEDPEREAELLEDFADQCKVLAKKVS